MKINREVFYKKFRENFGSFSQAKFESIDFLLDKLDESQKIDRLSKYAYVLATIKWETADTFNPITELGSQKYLKSKSYYPYIGRGYVQLTWKSNYIAFGNNLGLDLVRHPELANDHETAWEILEEGMTDLSPKDPEFTRYSLEDFFTDEKQDWVGARRIINGIDHRYDIAEIAKKFYDCLEYEKEA